MLVAAQGAFAADPPPDALVRVRVRAGVRVRVRARVRFRAGFGLGIGFRVGLVCLTWSRAAPRVPG